LKGLAMSMVAINGPHSLDIMHSIKELTANSTRLMHLDLSNDNLGEAEVMKLAEGMKVSMCLLAVHLSGNFITPEVREQLRKMLKAKSKVSEKKSSPQKNIKTKGNCFVHSNDLIIY